MSTESHIRISWYGSLVDLTDIMQEINAHRDRLQEKIVLETFIVDGKKEDAKGSTSIPDGTTDWICKYNLHESEKQN